MQLTRHTDYSLRVLMYLGVNPGRMVTIAEISEAYDISRNHLMKVVHELGGLGFVETFRGKQGGIQLARALEAVNVGDVVRQMEENLDIVNCNEPVCPIESVCILREALDEARDAFLAVLDEYTLADLIDRRKRKLRMLLGAASAPSVIR